MKSFDSLRSPNLQIKTLIWRFLKMGTPKSSIYRWIFHYRPSMLRYLHWKFSWVELRIIDPHLWNG